MAKNRTKAKKAAKASTGESDKVKPSEVRAVIPASKLRSLLASMRKTKSDVGELNGELGTEIKNGTNKYHFSRRVLRMLSTFDNLPPEKLAIELEDLEHGLEASGLNERAATAPRMQFGPGEEAGEESDEGEGRSRANVRQFPPPNSVAAE